MALAKRMIAAVGTMALLIPIAACGSGSAGTSGAADKSSGATTNILVWSWDSTLPRTVKDFEKANPGIKVKVTNAGTNKDEYTALNNAMSAGKGAPDIAQNTMHCRNTPSARTFRTCRIWVPPGIRVSIHRERGVL